MEYLKDLIPGLVVTLIGIAVVAVVKATLRGFIYDMQKIFMTKEMCGERMKTHASEREDMRKEFEHLRELVE